ncbi:hypothetical protein JZ751_026910 [Albula glossodonta]|uniref:Uncharacterized protein n=1 Tax=Albula glossodonta TaxID=121402 RepID=A0A8T2PDA9_9TELE|nr:hypothetical protein JZ751_026910 [Albula glossodonta]
MALGTSTSPVNSSSKWNSERERERERVREREGGGGGETALPYPNTLLTSMHRRSALSGEPVHEAGGMHVSSPQVSEGLSTTGCTQTR